MKPNLCELVVAEVREVHSNSIDAVLVEYGDMKAFLNVANIPGLWIRDVRKFIKKGDIIVARVVHIDGQAELSMKKVSKEQSDKRKNRYRKELKSVKMFKTVSKEFGIGDELADKAVEKLKEKYGGIYESIKLMREEETEFGLDGAFMPVLERFGTGEKTYEFKAELILHSTAGDGVDKIKAALEELGDVRASYLGSGRFMLKLVTTDPKRGEKLLEGAAQKAIDKMKSMGGIGEFKKIK
jgi:translation initiation factor 2 subunit 1